MRVSECEEHARTEGGRLERKGALVPGVSARRGSPARRVDVPEELVRREPVLESPGHVCSHRALPVFALLPASIHARLCQPGKVRAQGPGGEGKVLPV